MKKDWRLKELTVEVVVGVFVMLVLLGLGIFTIVLSGNNILRPHYSYDVYFQDIMGLREKDDVVVRGMKIGQIKSLRLEKNNSVHVTMNLDRRPALKDDCRFFITSKSPLGGRQMNIDEGANAIPWPEGKRLIGDKPVDILAEASEIIKDIREAFIDDGILDDMKSGASDMCDIAERLNSGKGMFGKLLSEDEQLYDDMVASVNSLKNLTAKIESGEGSIGRLVQDEDLYNEIKGLIVEARASVDDLRETSPIVTFTSIFFGAF